jgi:hypothetical protein
MNFPFSTVLDFGPPVHVSHCTGAEHVILCYANVNKFHIRVFIRSKRKQELKLSVTLSSEAQVIPVTIQALSNDAVRDVIQL